MQFFLAVPKFVALHLSGSGEVGEKHNSSVFPTQLLYSPLLATLCPSLMISETWPVLVWVCLLVLVAGQQPELPVHLPSMFSKSDNSSSKNLTCPPSLPSGKLTKRTLLHLKQFSMSSNLSHICPTSVLLAGKLACLSCSALSKYLTQFSMSSSLVIRDESLVSTDAAVQHISAPPGLQKSLLLLSKCY